MDHDEISQEGLRKSQARPDTVTDGARKKGEKRLAELSLTIPDRRARRAGLRWGEAEARQAGLQALAERKKQESRWAESKLEAGGPESQRPEDAAHGATIKITGLATHFRFHGPRLAGRMAGVASDILSAVTLRASLPLPAFGLGGKK